MTGSISVRANAIVFRPADASPSADAPLSTERQASGGERGGKQELDFCGCLSTAAPEAARVDDEAQSLFLQRNRPANLQPIPWGLAHGPERPPESEGQPTDDENTVSGGGTGVDPAGGASATAAMSVLPMPFRPAAQIRDGVFSTEAQVESSSLMSSDPIGTAQQVAAGPRTTETQSDIQAAALGASAPTTATFGAPPFTRTSLTEGFGTLRSAALIGQSSQALLHAGRQVEVLQNPSAQRALHSSTRLGKLEEQAHAVSGSGTDDAPLGRHAPRLSSVAQSGMGGTTMTEGDDDHGEVTAGADIKISVLRGATHFAPGDRHTPIQQIGAAVADEVRSAASSSIVAPLAPPPRSVLKTLEIRLEPREMGTVTVRMSLSGGNISLLVQVEAQDLAAQVDREREELSRLLNASGYALDELVVRVVEADKSRILDRASALTSQGGTDSSGDASSSLPPDPGAGGGQHGYDARSDGRKGKVKESLELNTGGEPIAARATNSIYI